MKNEYIIILYLQGNSGYTSLVDENDEVLVFDSVDKAREKASKNPLGKAFGYDIFEIGTGE